MKNNYLVVANWKLNPQTTIEAKKIFNGIKKSSTKLKNVNTVVCVPYVFISELKKLASKKCILGAQDVAMFNEGAHTGLVSSVMVKKLGCLYTIIGHSEVRSRGESDADVRTKVTSAVANDLIPIICVGEQVRDTQGFFWHTIKEQVTTAISNLPKKSLEKIIIAYEPVWAIGKDALRPATTAECFEVVLFIRKVISDMFSIEDAHNVQIIYGGSVTHKDSIGFIEHGGVDGYLVGHESLLPKNFEIILTNTENYANTQKNKTNKK
ncbi:MAG: triose-phosphate isomerase [Minisyncoccia bacterium]